MKHFSNFQNAEFRRCHSVVPPEAYYSSCVYDMCVCLENANCLCDILATYARECSKNGINLNWRTQSLCGQYHPYSFIFWDFILPKKNWRTRCFLFPWSFSDDVEVKRIQKKKLMHYMTLCPRGITEDWPDYQRGFRNPLWKHFPKGGMKNSRYSVTRRCFFGTSCIIASVETARRWESTLKWLMCSKIDRPHITWCGMNFYTVQYTHTTTSHLHSSRASTMLLRACDATPCRGSRPSDCFLSEFEGLDHAGGSPACSVVASGGDLSEEYRHDGLGVCLSDGQTEADRVPSRALLRRMPLYDLTDIQCSGSIERFHDKVHWIESHNQ